MRDVNDTGFKLVLGRSDWREQFGVDTIVSGTTGTPTADVVYDTEDRSVRLRSRIDRFPRRVMEPALSPSDRTSVARDRYGSWYWIDPARTTRIVVRNAGDETVETFWPPEPEPESVETESPETENGGPFEPANGGPALGPQPLRALTITTDHRLVVGAQSPNQLLVFDLHASGPPQRIPWFGSDEFAPIGATPRPDGGLYLLESPGGDDARVWALDRTFRPEGTGLSELSTSPFQPADAKKAEEVPPSPVSPPEGTTLPSEIQPQVIETLPDDTLLVLSTSRSTEGDRTSTVHRYRLLDPETPGAIEVGTVDLSTTLGPKDSADDVDWSEWSAHDIAFASGTPDPTEAFRGTLYVVGKDGNQAYAVSLAGDRQNMTATVNTTYLPLRRFSGKGLVESDGTVYYDLGDRWLPLTAKRRPRYVDRGRIRSAPFDSEITACTWHRIFLDACLPPETTVRVESRASDHPDRLSDQPWEPEPDFYRRDAGAEIPFYDPFPGNESGREGRGTWELLLQHAEGRYLQLRLTLSGNERAAPRLYALRVYTPRFSYLEEYLPELYQENEASADFLERFLANAEGMLTNIEGRIAAVRALFDVRTVPDEYLEWLGRWFGTSFNPALDSRRKRLFLKHAVELFNQRGTLAGLGRMLALVLDPCVDESLFTPAGIASAVGRADDADERTTRRGGVRLVEQFRSRDRPRAALGDATTPEQPVRVDLGQRWTYEDGAEVLHRRFRAFLDRERYDTSENRNDVWGNRPSFPPLLPATEVSNAEQKRGDWREFVRTVVEGPYAVIDKGTEKGSVRDEPSSATNRFRTFLQRRYRSLDELPPAWTQGVDSFESGTPLNEVELPPELPTGSALRDWMHFVGTALPIRRTAHRFRVLVPVDSNADVAAQRQRLNLARRVLEKEKPAHTTFEVVPYSAAFRVGSVRLGLDTVLGRGARYQPLLLGEGVLAEDAVGRSHPENVPDRRLVGRDAASSDRPL